MTISSPRLSRRAALTAGAALPLAAALTPTLASAASDAAGAQNAIQNSFTLGDLQVATLLAGTRPKISTWWSSPTCTATISAG